MGDLKTGDILACWDNSVISRLIRYITKQSISHIGIMYDDELIMESAWTGVRISKLSKFNKQYSYFVLRYPYANEENKSKVIEYLQQALGSKYDFIQFITIGLHKLFGWNIIDNNRKYICSELVWEAYKNAGIEIAPQVPDDKEVVPGDLLNSVILETVKLNIQQYK